MKPTRLLLALLIGIGGLSASPLQSAAQNVSVNFSVFQNQLSSYGRWVNNPRYGQVWIYNEPGFRPYYTNGYWDYTDYGWTWVSNYDWGWAPFHYGRWEQDPYAGWMWIPGYDWAPAWVSWSESGDYYGWAPLGHGIDININIGSIPHDRWVFCSRPYMNSPRFRDYCAPFGNNRVIVRNTTIINNVYNGGGRHRYYSGPNRGDVERYSRSPINTRRMDPNDRYNNRNRGGDYSRIGDSRNNNDRRNQNDRFENRRIEGNAADRNSNRVGEQRNRVYRPNAGQAERPQPERRIDNDNRQRNNGEYRVDRPQRNVIRREPNQSGRRSEGSVGRPERPQNEPQRMEPRRDQNRSNDARMGNGGENGGRNRNDQNSRQTRERRKRD